MKIRTAWVTEIFESIQGEGLRVGNPSIFIRLFGCNLTCAGFGMPVGEKSTFNDDVAERHKLIPFKSIDDLPLTPTGCDSYIAWDRRFRTLSVKYTSIDLANEIIKMIGNRKIDIVFTGGEPLLHQEFIGDVLTELSKTVVFLNVTFETNGTVEIKDEDVDTLRQLPYEYTFSISPKLSSSGEQKSVTYNLDAIESIIYFDNSFSKDVYLKFVVDPSRTEDMICEIQDYIDEMDLHHYDVYLMSVGGTYDEYIKNAPQVAKIAMETGYKYSPRLHIDLFKNSWST